MTKIDGRSKREAARQLDESLRRLQTDRIDLVQHHEIIRFEDPHRIFDDDGANAALVEARSRRASSATSASPGTRIRSIHLHMLEVARGARLHLRRRADAAQRDGRALPQLREAGAAGAGASRTSACSA